MTEDSKKFELQKTQEKVTQMKQANYEGTLASLTKEETEKDKQIAEL